MTITGAAHVDILRRADPVQQVKEDTSDITCIYIGLTPRMSTAVDETKWQIRRIENKDGVMTTLFANDAKYNNRWDQRAMLFPPCEGNQPVAGATDTNVVTIPDIHWIDFTVKDQEESYTFPNGTKRFLIRNIGSRDIQASYTLGDSLIAGQWYPIYAGSDHFEEEMGASITLYASITQNISGTQRLVLLSWR